ncbi:MAG: GDP-mannose 4,6-dehydratase [Candidatus Altiarchaeales archaeon]|nr:GDP-mannose 4,6-dehydratase [Candidatus Altiarchaeota archaeon]MBU4341118.1 GDP-mannose 4,6-dehydratase [Candidatus Altiarchaeota archaeon]MBU4437880.1 GDP-mannose 4,6-dehydratase [Candidatus Altiarchaeota archaeon]MCG2782173.1 GDP-mannose 4,6-dehydratase [Candidatus Altiarchaeales archaeon]
MKIIVTGGAGFIGSHLCDYLLDNGHEVICIDNLLTGSEDNISHLKNNENFEFVNHDVTEFIKVDGDLDYILHFASPASPVDYLELPIQTLKVGSLGTHNALGLAKAKNAKFLLASTSEVYGDPLVHPQPESYWGNVNPTGPRGVYDEAKRFAEAITLAYHRTHKINTRIARIFNSILADQPVVLFNDNNFHLTEIGGYVDTLESEQDLGRRILVPAFDINTCEISLYEVSNVIKHPYCGDAYEIRTSYGRKVKVTGDHSVFTKGENSIPVAIPVRNLNVGDYIALPAKLPVIEKDLGEIVISDELIKNCPDDELWDYALQSDSLKEIISKNKDRIYEILDKSRRYKYGRRNFYNLYKNRFLEQSLLPLYVIKELNVEIPPDAKIRVYSSGAHIYTPNRLKITNEILWLIGFYLAEGSSNYTKGKNYFITFSSDGYLLRKAKKIMEGNFGVHVVEREYKEGEGRAPAIFIHSKVFYFIFDKIFQVIRNPETRELRIPSWIFQLPLCRLKYFLEGFREGDGTHSGKKMGNELCFDTTDEKLALDLTMLLLRFGIVASVGEYTTQFKQKYGDRRFKFYRLTICEVSTFDILKWDKGVKQKLLAKTKGDLVWAKVRKIKKCKPSEYVYDFSVPKAENFMAGNGVCCHNTFGPRMRMKDGRVVPNFMTQALTKKPLTVYGDGSQTRSFCYISDMVEGIYKLMLSNETEPVNIGNPEEMSIIDFANKIKKLTGSESEIVFEDLPVDDPKTRQPDITKAKKVLGWEPKVSLEEGLKKTIDWFKTKI